MKVVIEKDFLGNKRNLVLDDDSCYWLGSSCEDADLVLDFSENNSLNSILSLYGIEPIRFVDKNFVKLCETLGIKNPEWKFILPQKVYSKKIRKFQEQLKEVKSFLGRENYLASFASGNRVLRNLSRIKPNEYLLKEFISKETNPTLKSIISSFLPEEDGYCRPITYNRLKTVTGRLIVNNGPQALLLPREMKKIIQSRYGKDGSIVWVDFVSLEPRFTKLITTTDTQVDIYEDILKLYNLECTRKQIKLAVLSTLFGAGLSKITSIVGKEAVVARRAIKEYFCLDRILSLTGDYKSGKIKNYFDRPINLKKSTANVAINNYIQSSSVDVSLMGFSSIVEDPELPKSVRPLCVIHDALVLDVRNSDIDKMIGIINKGVHIDSVGHFFLGFELYESNS